VTIFQRINYFVMRNSVNGADPLAFILDAGDNSVKKFSERLMEFLIESVG
jgi:hypothetical protein